MVGQEDRLLESVRSAVSRTIGGEALSEGAALAVFDALLAGEIDEASIETMLGAMAARGATVDELVGAAKALRANARPVLKLDSDTATPPILDTCGTGGAPKLFN